MTNGERKAVSYLRLLTVIMLMVAGLIIWLGFVVKIELTQARDNKIEALRNEASSLRAAFSTCEARTPRRTR
jgi:hypothetical protein